MITFETKNLKGRRNVLIDGHPFVVRRFGNIENIEYSKAVRKLQILAEAEAKRKLTIKESEQVDTISGKLAEMMVALFDDGGDQSKSRALVGSLNESEINELLTLAFAEKEEVSDGGKED